MGYLTIAVLALTAISIIFGMLFGLKRGRNRAIARLILIVLSAVLAFLLRGVIVDFLMGLNIGEGTLKETLAEALSGGETALPESLTSLVFALVELIIGLASFVLLFFILRFITWLIIFNILKKFIKKGENKHGGAGALIGLVQGILIAIIVWSPLTGLIIQVDKFSKVEMDGKPVLELPEEIGLSDYTNSIPSKIYTTTGGWLFDMLTTTTDEDGKKVSVSTTVDVVTNIVGIADKVTDLSTSMDTMTSEESSAQEKVNAMKNVGNDLVAIGDTIDSLDDETKELINDLLEAVKDMAGEEGEMAMFEDLNLSDLKLASAGESLIGIATYMEKTNPELSGEGEVTTEEVNSIVNGLAENVFILDMIKEEGTVPAILPVESEDASMFESAINESQISDENKLALRQFFGLI